MTIKATQILSLLGFCLLLGSSVFADTLWDNGDGDFIIINSLNWASGLPNNLGNDGIISNGDTVISDGRHDLDDKNFVVSGGSKIHHTSTVNQLRWEDGTITLNGGHLEVDYAGTTVIGRDSGSLTTLNIYAGSTVDLAGGLEVGRLSQGLVNQYGGSMLVNGTINIQTNGTGVSSDNIYHLSGGTVTGNNFVVYDRNADNSNWFNFTPGSTGSLTIKQSSFDFASFINADEIRINNLSATVSDFTIDTSVGGQTTISVIPEPGSFILVLGGFALLFIGIRRRVR